MFCITIEEVRLTGPGVGAAWRWVSAEEVKRALTITAAIDALEDALRKNGFPPVPARMQLDTPDGTLLTMPAAAAAVGGGVKLVTVAPGNGRYGLPLLHGLFVYFAPETMQPLAVLEASALTELRTSAVSALATRHLARADADRLVIFGVGAQARAHLVAMLAVRPISTVAIVHPNPSRAEDFVRWAIDLGVDAYATDPSAVRDADIVCTCTTSSMPLFDGRLLPNGAHVNAIGAFQPHTRELDDATMARALIVVETRGVALAEAGDVILAAKTGALDRDAALTELPELVRSGLSASSDHDITVFKSVGHAYEDLVVAAAVLGALEVASL